MPTVPYAQQRIEPAALPGPRLSPEAPAEAFGAPGVGRVSDAAVAIINDEKRKSDQLAVLEADKDLSALGTRLEYDKQAGFRNRQGKDAFGVPKQVSEDFNKGAGEIAARMTNEAQRAALHQRILSHQTSLDGRVQHYVYGERQKYDLEVTDAFISNERDAAALAAGSFNSADPVAAKLAKDRINLATDRQVAALVDHADKHGRSDEWLKDNVNKTISGTHVMVIDKMLANQQDLAAQKYYHANKNGISGKDSITIDKALEEGIFRGKSQRTTDSIMNSGGSWEDRLTAAKKIGDPKLRDDVTQRIKVEMGTEATLRRDWQDNAFLNSVNSVEKSGDISTVPPTTWVQLLPHQRQALESVAEHARNGTEPKNDPDKWLQFMSLTPAELASMSPAEFKAAYQPSMDKAHYGRAIEAWSEVRKAPDATKLSGMLSDGDIVKGAYASTIKKPDYKKWSDDEKLGFIKFEGDAAAAVNRYETINKRKATDEEKQKIINDTLIKKVFVERSFWYDKEDVLVSQIKEDQRGKVYVPMDRIPPKARADFVNLARSYGVIDQKTDSAEAERLLAPRIAKAYGAYLIGGSPEQIRSIIKGGK